MAKGERSRRVQAAFFNVGDEITYGRYQNHKGKILEFKDDGKGNPLVVIEPVPKGRKKNKTIALFKIRHVKDGARTARTAKIALDVMARFVARNL